MASEPPVVEEGSVYVLSRGVVLALDVATGSELWKTPPTSPAQLDTLVVEDGSIYLFDFGRPGSGEVVALDAEDGSVRWHREGGSYRPVLVDDIVYVHNTSTIAGLDAADGTQSWSHESRSNATVQTVANGTMFIFESSRVWAVDVSTGTRLWSVVGSWSDIGMHEGLVHLHGWRLIVVDASNGSMIWGTPARYGISSSFLSDGVFYHGSEMFDDGTWRLFARNSSDGAELWRMAFTSSLERPLIDNGVFYVAHGKTVSAYDTGVALPPFPAPAEPVVKGSPGVDAFLALVAMVGGLLAATLPRREVR